MPTINMPTDNSADYIYIVNRVANLSEIIQTQDSLIEQLEEGLKLRDTVIRDLETINNLKDHKIRTLELEVEALTTLCSLAPKIALDE